MRAGRVNILGTLLILALTVAGIWLYTFGPYYWNKRVMDQVVKSSALYWKDLGQARAQKQLHEELVNRDVPMYIQDKDCKFNEEVGKKRVVCEWTVQENWPFTKWTKTMHFLSEAVIYPDGIVQ
jgi:hypothetical protein